MKHLIKPALISLLLTAFALVSCGGAKLKAIDEKIENEGMEANFTSGEYDAMLGFIEKIMEEAPQYKTTDDAQMEKFGDDFGKMFTYTMVLGLAGENRKLTTEQMVRFEKIVKNSRQISNNEGLAVPNPDETELSETYIDDEISEGSNGSHKLIVDLNGNIVGDYVGETSTEYLGVGQDEFSVPKKGHKVIELNAENGAGVVFCKEPGDVVKVYSEPSLNASVIGKIVYEEGYLPDTYECIGKESNWYKIRFNRQTGYVLENQVEWSAESYY